jgi:hypothetical protein
VFTIFVRSYADRSVVRLDVAFADPNPGKNQSTCRSTGVLEKTFFERLESQLGERAH